MKKIPDQKLAAFSTGLMGSRGLSKRELEELKKKEEEEAAAHVFKEFVETFQEVPSTTSKVWVKAGTYDAGARKEDTSERGKLYKPTSRLDEKRTPSEAEIVRSLIKAESSSRSSQKNKLSKDKKKSNLELFKEELRQIQEERSERHKFKNVLRERGVIGVEPIIPDIPDIGSYDTGDPNTTNLYLGNLSPKITEQQLMEIFGRYGPLASIKIMWPRSDEEKARGRNCGFVAFMSRKDGERALRCINAAGDIRSVRSAGEHQDHVAALRRGEGARQELRVRRVHVAQGRRASAALYQCQQQLLEIFGRYGPLASIKIMWPRSDEEKARGRNCGFVAFMSRKDGERALRCINGGHYFIKLMDPLKKTKSYGYVIKLMDLFQQQLTVIFGRYGPLASIKIMWPRSDEEKARGRNCGFVAFMSRKDGERALRCINGGQQQLMEIFGRYGPLASIKIMWPRSDEEKARGRNCGFVAFMSRKDGERALRCINVYSQQQLMEIFGRYGPLASIKIMWPRSDEEKARGRNCGFVAFMSRKDGERALRCINGGYTDNN
ncbi:RNA recognition motif domain-containing protein [Phthorimaea operculella]|nr:RNA recognition motif domain-containing protein [Phthorimaea operculella]